MKPFLCSLLYLVAVTSTSIAQQRGADMIFKRADKNADGKVTPDELPNAETFARFDLDKDGVITLEEGRQAIAGVMTQPSEAQPPAERLFRFLDKDGDGAISGDEIIPQAKKLREVDADKDGRITRGEALEALKRYADRGGEMPPEKPGPATPSESTNQGPVMLKAGDAGIGRQVADTSFTTLAGESKKISDVSKAKGLVIAMNSATCPVSKRYMPSLAKLEKELAAQNIALLLVNPFASETVDEIKAQLAAASITAPYAHDKDEVLAAALGARSTTEVFLLDHTRTLVYRGALDDQYGLKYNLDTPRANYLRDAVSAMIAGLRPVIAATESPGCELDLPEAKRAAVTEITYHRDVARILQQNCVTCHRADGIGPFALDDLAEVTDRAKTIKRVISDGTMPPWFAAPVKEGEKNPWANDCSLSARDKTDLLAWLDSPNRPVGDMADAPAKAVFVDEWTIGKPDYIVALPRPVPIKADGYMPYQFITAETTLAEDRWVQGYEIVPTDRTVVHHVIVNVHAKGSGRIRDREEGAGGYWAAYVPGNSSQVYPAGFARKLPAGSTVSFQIHYTPSGKATQDQLRMGLVFAKEPPRYVVETVALPKRGLKIAPGAPDHIETSTRRIPFDMNAMAFMAHMHVRGKSFKYELLGEDGSSETLLDIPRYDFNWQLRYDLAAPRFIPRGATLKITAVYDNSPGNKANPDPTQTVRWGPQTYDEMMIGYIEVFKPVSRAVAMD